MSHFPERLKSARKMKGYSLQELANAMGNVVTKQALSKYEAGVMKPDGKVLSSLCKVLEVNPDYFFREPRVALEVVEFRKLKKLSKKGEAIIKERTIDFLERYIELEALQGIETRFANPIQSIAINSASDVELAVGKLRKAWNLGLAPISNVVEMLEMHDIKVVQIDADDAFSGLSTFVNNRIPVIVLNNHKDITVVRKRFTALHELGHLLLDIRVHDSKERERICHAFAGAMLLPEPIFKLEFGGHRHHVLLHELLLIKQEYGISMTAIMYRAKELGLISHSYFQSFMIEFSKRGYKKNEPGTFYSDESSNRFMQLLLRAVAEEVISTSKAAALNGQKLSEFRMVMDKMD